MPKYKWHKREPSGEVWGPWGGGKIGKIVKNSGKSPKIRVLGVLHASDRFENLINEFPDLENPQTAPLQYMWRILWLGIIGKIGFLWYCVHWIAPRMLLIDFYTI